MKMRVVGGVGLALALGVACSSGPAQGDEGGACFPNGTCNTGLTCLSNLCVNAGTDAGNDVNVADTSTPNDAANDVATEAASDASADVASDVSTDVASDVSSDAAAWDPSQLAGLAVWLRADKGVSTDNSGVIGWADQSSNHNDFTPSTSTHPSLVASAFNGLPAVDVTTNTMTGHATTIGTGAFTIEIVVGNVSANTGIFMTINSGNEFDLFTNTTGPVVANLATINPIAGVVGTKVITGSAAHLIGFTRDGSGGIALRIDGAADGTPATGGGLDLGNFPNAIVSGGEVPEMVIVAGTLSAQQVTELEAYLKSKYAL